jgi:hypothetical protein
MQKMIDRMRDLDSKLEQANQKVLELTRERDGLINTNRELTKQLEQANRKIEELANQLKPARSGGESSSHPTKSRDQESREIREWFEQRLNDAAKRHEERERAKQKKWWK